MSAQESIIFIGVDVDLFKSCFFRNEEEQWSSYELVVLGDESTKLSEALGKPGVVSVVFQDTELDGSHLQALKQFYDSGGLVVFFGIYGEFSDPSKLSERFVLPEAWSFSAYTKHEYEITYTASDYIGLGVKEQKYTKANLLRVPIQDRWLVPKPLSLHHYIEEDAGCLDGEAPDQEWRTNAERARAGYVAYCEGLYQQCPLAVHKNEKGGMLAYLGFVNGDDNIPKIVRSLVTKKEIERERERHVMFRR